MPARPENMTSPMAQYPWNETPIHEFKLEGQKLVHNVHHKYIPPREIEGKRGNYRIWTDMRIVYKSREQLDRFLNNHLWTFDGDEGQALAYMRARLDEDKRLCKKELERLRKLESQLSAAEADYAANRPEQKTEPADQ